MGDKKKILIVEDEQAVLDAYIKALENRFDVEIARNGEDGIEKLKSSKPDLVIVDIIMPIKHGHDFLMEKKNMEEFENVPVFVMTNVKSNAEMSKAKMEGANEYFVKFETSLEDLNAKIDSYLS